MKRRCLAMLRPVLAFKNDRLETPNYKRFRMQEALVHNSTLGGASLKLSGKWPVSVPFVQTDLFIVYYTSILQLFVYFIHSFNVNILFNHMLYNKKTLWPYSFCQLDGISSIIGLHTKSFMLKNTEDGSLWLWLYDQVVISPQNELSPTTHIPAGDG